MRARFDASAALLLSFAFLATGCACRSRQPCSGATPAPPNAVATPASVPTLETRLEPKAIDVLKAASDRLARARSMKFTAIVSYENPSLLGPPLIYTTKSDVTVERPDKLRAITKGDGPASEFYYDGKTMTAYAPAEGLVAVTAAPPTIDGALKTAFDSAATYFPFTDLVVADPYGDIADGLKRAFYIGESHIVGGTTTDMIAYADETVFVQAWIGAKDKLPRRLRAVYRNDPAELRHQMDLSDWRLDMPVPASAFAPPRAAAYAKPIPFERPDPALPAETGKPASDASPRAQ